VGGVLNCVFFFYVILWPPPSAPRLEPRPSARALTHFIAVFAACGGLFSHSPPSTVEAHRGPPWALPRSSTRIQRAQGSRRMPLADFRQLRNRRRWHRPQQCLVADPLLMKLQARGWNVGHRRPWMSAVIACGTATSSWQLDRVRVVAARLPLVQFHHHGRAAVRGGQVYIRRTAQGSARN